MRLFRDGTKPLKHRFRPSGQSRRTFLQVRLSEVAVYVFTCFVAKQSDSERLKRIIFKNGLLATSEWNCLTMEDQLVALRSTQPEVFS